ncbi:MAG: hypothetical protein IPK37_08335 [Austwickia sp.]|jgi:hypothetical protein|nr:MAG: hypothetical protein IPK37_08335 [Austwickia sp.]
MSADLADLYRRVAGSVDSDARAWVIGVGRLTECADLQPVSTRALLAGASARGVFPAGPFGVAPELVEVVFLDAEQRAEATLAIDQPPSFVARMGLAGPGVYTAMSRSGQLDDGSREPSHVMLSDVEAVLIDTLELTEAYAAELGYAGPAQVLVGVESAVPGRPLELRVHDELCGDNLRPAAGYSSFDPLRVDYPGRLDEESAEQLRWDTAVRIAHTFGVFMPQLVGQAKTVTMIAYRPSPQAS